MEIVETGYKANEIGKFPTDWIIKKLSDITDVIDPHPSHRAPAEVNVGVPFLGIGDLDENGNIITNSPRVVSEKVLNEHHQRYNLKEDLIGLGRVASIGKVIRLKSDIGDYLISPTIAVIRSYEIPSSYILYVLQSEYIKSYFQKIMSGSTRSSVGMKVLREVPILLPPTLQEQRAIATSLSDVDALIQKLDDLIEKKQDIKKATMQLLLTGKKRLDGFDGEWVERKIGDLCDSFSGGTPLTSNEVYYGGEINWITSSDLNRKRIFEVEGRITQLGLMNSSAKMVAKGTVLIAMYGATAGAVAVTEINSAINQAVLALIPHSIDREFLLQKLSLLKDWIVSFYTQGGQPNLSGKIIREIIISCPPTLNEQRQIGSLLFDMDVEIQNIQSKKNKYVMIKQGMMQELLTGKTRLI